MTFLAGGSAVRALGPDPHELFEVPGYVFVTDRRVRERPARAHRVDMEDHTVVWACRELGVPVRLVEHVSDNADETALARPATVAASARVPRDRVRDRLSASFAPSGP